MKLKEAYKEWINCGNNGTLIDYIKTIGITPEELQEETQEDSSKPPLETHITNMINKLKQNTYNTKDKQP